MNLYIESIEGGNYIAGFGEERADTMIKNKQNGTLSFQCINSIKQEIKGQIFDKVWLKQITPYEEMCGLNSSTEAPSIALDWH